MVQKWNERMANPKKRKTKQNAENEPLKKKIKTSMCPNYRKFLCSLFIHIYDNILDENANANCANDSIASKLETAQNKVSQNKSKCSVSVSSQRIVMS